MIKETIATASHVVKMQQAQARMDKYGENNPNKEGILLSYFIRFRFRVRFRWRSIRGYENIDGRGTENNMAVR